MLLKNRTIRRAQLALAIMAAALCTGAQAVSMALPSSQDMIAFLNQSIVWYRQLTAQQQLANQPSDIMFFNDNRQLADQVVRLSFDYARAQAKLLSAQRPELQPQTPSDGASSHYQSLVQATAKADQQVKTSQQELESLRRRLDASTGRQRRILESSIAEVQSELELRQARRDALRNMISFVGGTNANNVSTGSLESEIEELARTLPPAATELTPKQATGQTTAEAAAPRREEPSGILGLATDLFALRRKIRIFDDSLALTDQLAAASKTMRAPAVAAIRDLIARGDALAGQPQSQDGSVLDGQKKQLDAITAQFRQLSASVLPLGKQRILLDLYRRSLLNWRGSVQTQYNAELKSLILRLAALAVMLAGVIGISEIWRRATFRYVQDVRRRYQFLLVRRMVVWFVVAVIVAIAFASELGSLATFAGLLTAGVAVALQNVILSVAGYFFLIGKYGVRVGDRVQIASVTGDVIDIGLVRLHLMEVDSRGAGARPTGRVVVFSNSVVFQANSGLFKQIPGTSFVWHQITLSVAGSADYREVEQRIMAAVGRVCEAYRENIERQQRMMQRALSPMPVGRLGPESRLQLTPSGAELIVRYAVELEHAAEIDDRITREVLDLLGRDPKLALAGSPVLASCI